MRVLQEAQKVIGLSHRETLRKLRALRLDSLGRREQIICWEILRRAKSFAHGTFQSTQQSILRLLFGRALMPWCEDLKI